MNQGCNQGGSNGVKKCDIENPKVRRTIIPLFLGKKLISKIGISIILSDFPMCCHAQTNQENTILSQSHTTEQDF